VYDSGIAVEDGTKLFEAFNSSKLKGNGLGLVLCKQIAQAHGGDVVFDDSKKKVFEVIIDNADSVMT